MSVNYIVYDSTTGQIKRTGVCAPVALPYQALTGESVIEGVANDLLNYIDVTIDSIETKTTMPYTIDTTSIAADGVAESNIIGLPDNVLVRWPDGSSEVVTDNAVEFSTTQPGTYTIQFDAVPHLLHEIEITAT